MQSMQPVHSSVVRAALCSVVVFVSSLMASALTVNEFEAESDTDWNTAANWSLGHVPTSGECALVQDKTVQASVDITVGALALTNANFSVGTDSLTNTQYKLTVAGDLTVGGTSKLYIYAAELPTSDWHIYTNQTAALKLMAAKANVVSIGGAFDVGDTAVVYPTAANLTGVPVIFRTGTFTLGENASFNVALRGWGISTDLWENRPQLPAGGKEGTYVYPVRGNTSQNNNWPAYGWTFCSGISGYYDGSNYGASRVPFSNYSSERTRDNVEYKVSTRYGYDFAPLFPGAPMARSCTTQERIPDARGSGSIVVLASGLATVNGTLDANGTRRSVLGWGSAMESTSGGGIWIAGSDVIFGANAKLWARALDLGAAIAAGFSGGSGGRIAVTKACTAAEIDSMIQGTLPDGMTKLTSISGVETTVARGLHYYGNCDVGTLAMVVPTARSANMTVAYGQDGLSGAEAVCGTSLVLTGTSQTFTAPEYATLVVDAGVRYRCTGYVISNATEAVESGSGHTVTTTLPAGGPYTLTWQWGERSEQTQVVLNGSGTVTYKGTDYTSSFGVFLSSAETSVMTATPSAAGGQVVWTGRAIPNGYSTASSVTLRSVGSSTIDVAFSSGNVPHAWKSTVKSGDWHTAANWTPESVPTAFDDVTIGSGTITVSRGIAANSLTVGGAAKVTFTAVGFVGATTTNAVREEVTSVKIAGALRVEDTAVVTVANDTKTGAAMKFRVGSFYLAEGAKIDADRTGWGRYSPDDGYGHLEKGDTWTRAFGGGFYMPHAGAGHAVKGYRASDALPDMGLSYGFKFAPFLPGSPNSTQSEWKGGGTVWLVCEGLAEIKGVITAGGGGTPLSGSGYDGCSGGGIWLAALGFKFGDAALLAANASQGCQSVAFSSGGRISLAIGCTDAQLESLALGEEPDDLTYSDTIDLVTATVLPSCTQGDNPTWGTQTGTVTTVVGPNAFQNVLVKGDPVQAMGVAPVYGTGAYPKNSSQTFTAPAYGIDPNDSYVRYACAGYILTDAAGTSTTGTTASVTFTVAEGPYTVTWLWGAKSYAVSLRKPEHGQLKLGGVLQAGDVWVWANGASEPVEVVPDEGYEFVCWQGLLPIGQERANPISFTPTFGCEMTPLLRLAEAATERVWSGTGVWTDAAKWSPANVPGPNDAVVIASGTCAVSNALACASLTVTGGVLTVGAAGPVNPVLAVTDDLTLAAGSVALGQVKTMTGHGLLTVGGDLVVSNAAVLTACGGPVDAAYTFATGTTEVRVNGTFELADTAQYVLESDFQTGGSVKTVARRFIVGSAAKVTADARGWRWVSIENPPTAPGIGYWGTRGASYGNYGEGKNDSVPLPPYGFELSPVHPGSPSGCYGNALSNATSPGGLVRIHARELTVNGLVTATANTNINNNVGRHASGGGIWLTANRIAFGPNAVLAAMGAAGGTGSNAAGSGGRISVGRGFSEADLAALAATGTWPKYKASKVRNEAAFRAAVGNGTMTIDVNTVQTADSPFNGPGTFTYVDGRVPGLMLLVR